MSDVLAGTGVDPEALERYIAEQIYTVVGTERHREQFSVLLTGRRAAGTFAPSSDVDIDVVCPRTAFDSVVRASFEAGIIPTDRTFFCLFEGFHRADGSARRFITVHAHLSKVDIVLLLYDSICCGGKLMLLLVRKMVGLFAGIDTRFATDAFGDVYEECFWFTHLQSLLSFYTHLKV